MQDVPTLAQTIAQALDGRTPRPSVESWQPYELENIVDQYVQTLLGDD